MSLAPAFEIGLWNAWIFKLCALLAYSLPTLTPLRKERFTLLAWRSCLIMSQLAEDYTVIQGIQATGYPGYN